MEKRKLILVVDDIVHNFDVIEALLFKENYDLKYAADGLQALDLLTEIQPDLILLDVNMPSLDGIEVCRRIKSNPNTCYIPIVITTALNSKEDMARSLDAGADDFISKPINGLELRARVKSMLRIKQQYDNLKETLQLREDMSSMIVHDLRTPISNIALACDMLLYSDLEEKQRNKVETIFYAWQRLSSLIDDLLIMAKMESGKLNLNKTSVDINDLVKNVVGDFTQFAINNKIQLITELSESNQSLSVDANLFRRLLENLLSNAIKFSPSHSQVSIKVDCLNVPEADIQIQVIDRGLGVEEELKESIFNKYDTGNNINKNIHQIGLGLAFCKMVVDAHQGKIFVEDNQPKGSIFTVQI